MLEADFDRTNDRLGIVDDISAMDEHEALTPGPIRPDVDGVIQRRTDDSTWKRAGALWQCDRIRSLAKELSQRKGRTAAEHKAEYYLRRAARVLEESSND